MILKNVPRLLAVLRRSSNAATATGYAYGAGRFGYLATFRGRTILLQHPKAPSSLGLLDTGRGSPRRLGAADKTTNRHEDVGKQSKGKVGIHRRLLNVFCMETQLWEHSVHSGILGKFSSLKPSLRTPVQRGDEVHRVSRYTRGCASTLPLSRGRGAPASCGG